MLIGTFCPNTLYPFAREAIADVIGARRLPAVPAPAHQLRWALRAGDARARDPRRRADGRRRAERRGDSLAPTGSRCSAPAPGVRRSQYSSRARATRPCFGHAIVLRSRRWPPRGATYAIFPTHRSPHSSKSRVICARRWSAPRSRSWPSRARAFARCSKRSRPLPVTRLAWATKGFELDTGLLPYQVVAELFADGIPTAVLSGPTFAREVGAGLPSAMTVASTNRAYAQQLAAVDQHRHVSGLHVGRRDRRRGRRRDQERLRDRRRHLRWPRLRREHANRVDRARARRDDAPRARARRARADVHGPRGHGRPRADLHRRPIAQPAVRARARARRERRGRAARDRSGRRRLQRRARRAPRRGAPRRRDADRRAAATRCCTKAATRATPSPR